MMQMPLFETAIWALWWVWLCAALILAIAEVMIPGFIFLGFAIGAAGVAVILLLPIKIGLAGLLVVFGLLSLLAWAVLRRLFRGPGGRVRIVREDVNKW